MNAKHSCVGRAACEQVGLIAVRHGQKQFSHGSVSDQHVQSCCDGDCSVECVPCETESPNKHSTFTSTYTQQLPPSNLVSQADSPAASVESPSECAHALQDQGRVDREAHRRRRAGGRLVDSGATPCSLRGGEGRAQEDSSGDQGGTSPRDVRTQSGEEDAFPALPGGEERTHLSTCHDGSDDFSGRSTSSSPTMWRGTRR